MIHAAPNTVCALETARSVKRCSRCAKEKPFAQFYRHRRRHYSSRCRDCHGLAIRTCIVCGNRFEGRSNAKLCTDNCRRMHRPQTFLTCQHCNKRFGPVERLARKFCSQTCKVAAQTTGRSARRQATPEARRAQGLVAYYVKTGKLKRPDVCSECGNEGRIEAAHENYHDPLAIRWLCRSCHTKWDWRDPKGGVVPKERVIREAPQSLMASKIWGVGTLRTDLEETAAGHEASAA